MIRGRALNSPKVRFVSGGFDVGTRAKIIESIVKGKGFITDYRVKAQQRTEERQERRATIKRRK